MCESTAPEFQGKVVAKCPCVLALLNTCPSCEEDSTALFILWTQERIFEKQAKWDSKAISLLTSLGLRLPNGQSNQMVLQPPCQALPTSPSSVQSTLPDATVSKGKSTLFLLQVCPIKRD